MKTMKIWRIMFAMLAAFSLASCSNDDDELQIDQLAGTWQQVYDIVRQRSPTDNLRMHVWRYAIRET